MSTHGKFLLYVYDGDYGLPSMAVECTQSILFCAVAKVPVEVRLLNTIKHCMLYSAPSLLHKNLGLKSFKDIILYLRTRKYNLDKNLNAKQSSEALALTNLVQAKMKPVLEYMYWLDQRNSDELINLWFMKALPMPFNYIHTRRFKEQALTLIETLYPQEFTLESIKECLNAVATECLSTLSARLGNSEYFFGNSPSTLDVVVYSYLAPLHKIPFPSNDIGNLVSLWPNLVNFIKRIDAKYLADLMKDSRYLKQEERVPKNDDEISYVAISLLTVSAMSLVIGFAFSKGLVTSKMFY